jgi:hypothetical protein
MYLYDQLITRLLKFKHVERTVQQQCQKNNLRNIPHEKNVVMIPTLLATTLKNYTFLLVDPEPEEHRTLIFTSSD